ncbi:MAG TPA: hypothetical protein VGN74_11395 [Brevundimonas sp.]|jgi:hypothetical protein|uniref:hypothetical protein n=1 Tax=Brevundimonas sp. TaxID=1871086 RepID=UPI002E1610CF|nr:hypothetical protein [Brevundimonas sp.]
MPKQITKNKRRALATPDRAPGNVTGLRAFRGVDSMKADALAPDLDRVAVDYRRATLDPARIGGLLRLGRRRQDRPIRLSFWRE